jgi:hypothetical protein
MSGAGAMVSESDDLLGRPSPVGIAHVQYLGSDTLERGYYSPFLSNPRPDACARCRTMY